MRSEAEAKIVRIVRKRASKRAGETRFRYFSEPVIFFCSLVRQVALVVVSLWARSLQNLRSDLAVKASEPWVTFAD